MSSKIRMRLYEDESMSDDIKPFVRMFLGDCHGVIIRKRSPNDYHVMFSLVVEDDGYWFPYNSGESDSFWLDDSIAAMNATRDWCEKKCNKLPNGGWAFKEGTRDVKVGSNKNGSWRPIIEEKS